MEQTDDEVLLKNIVQFLRSENEETILSTCEFLETVVIYDLPANVFIYQRELIICLLKLCQNAKCGVACVACSCVESICRRIVCRVQQHSDPTFFTISKLLSSDKSDRNAGDGVEGEVLIQSSLALTIVKACHQMILASAKPFDYILKILVAASELSLSAKSSKENLEFLQVFASVSVALRAASRQNFVTFLLLLVKCIEKGQISGIGNDVVYEIYNGLLDASITHFHPEIVPSCQAILQEHNLTLYGKYQKALLLFTGFRNLAKFLKSSRKKEYQTDDLLPVVALLKLDDRLAESLLPAVFNHLKEFGGKPAIAMTLLLLSEEGPIRERIYLYLVELASPVKSRTIGPHIAELLVDNDVVRAIKDGMLSGSERITPNAEKLLTLFLKGRTWMNEAQWRTLMKDIIPNLILDIGPNLLRFKMLGSTLWELIQQSVVLPVDDSPCLLDLDFVLRFLIRNLSSDSIQKGKSSLSLVSALVQQPQAHHLHPRISAIDPTALTEAFQDDAALQLKSTAKFEGMTLTDTMEALLHADLVNARTCLIKLAIILEDSSLHDEFLKSDGLSVLSEFLHRALVAADSEPCFSIMSSIVKSLLYLAHFDKTVQAQIAQDSNLLLNLLRATILTREDMIARRHSTSLLRLLSSEQRDASSRVQLATAAVAPEWADLWSKAVIRWSAKFVFNAELSTPPLISSVPSFLQMNGSELELGMAANDCALIEKALTLMSSASGYQDVECALALLREVLQRTNLPCEAFNLPWPDGLKTFFCVLPESSKDEEVFAAILQTLMLSFDRLKQIKEEQNVRDLSLFQWLETVITDERQMFWTLFSQQCQQYNDTGSGNPRLWPTLLRFVSAAVRLLTETASVFHILRFLCKTFEQENASQTYQLNSLKLILDCLVHTAAVVLASHPHTIDQSVVAALLRHATSTVMSFSSQSHGNKGRSVVQSCAQLINLLISLSRHAIGVPLPSLDWLMLLLQHPDPAVKRAGLHSCALVTRDTHMTDEMAETALAVLFNANECCSVVEQAAFLLSQHPRRLTEPAVRQVCAMASSSRIRLNQSLLAALYLLLVNGCLRVQAPSAWIAAVSNEIVPMMPSIVASADSRPDVKAAGFNLVYRTALLRSKLLPWLFLQSECTSAAIAALLSEKDDLVGEAALYLSLILQSESDAARRIEGQQSTGKVFSAVVHSIPKLWDVLVFVMTRKVDDSATRRILLFLQTFLVLTWTTLDGKTAEVLQLNADTVENFVRWLLPNLPARTDNSLRHSALQVLGVLFLCVHPAPTMETVKISTEFLVKELQLSVLHRSGEKTLTVLIRLAHNFIIRHTEAERELLQRGFLTPLTEICKTRAFQSKASALQGLIDLMKLLVGKEMHRDVRTLLKFMTELLEEKEATFSRQLTPISDEEWSLVESLHSLLQASVPSLECRRLLAKYKGWNNMDELWHPVHLKRIINKQQHWVLASLVPLRAGLLSSLTFHSEPVLPELLESRTVQTLVDLASQSSGTDRLALSVLRNMAFHASYKAVLLTTSSVLPLFVRLLIDSKQTDEETSVMAVAALVALASNNQRVKSDVRSMTDAWFQRNPIDPNRQDLDTFFTLCSSLRKLIDA